MPMATAIVLLLKKMWSYTMNDRWKELAEQATDDIMGVDVLDKRRFAELIVRECVEVALAQKQWVEEQDAFGERDRDWNRARIQQSQHIVDKVKEHFGVES
jgi:hypothetical protein